MIAGVPTQFDELVGHATARDPADRYADAQDMAAELDAIVDELGLPPFRVPAPRNSAQHTSTSLYLSQSRAQHATTETTAQPQVAPLLPPRQHTRELTRDDDWQPISEECPEYEHGIRTIRRNRPRRVLLGATASQAGTAVLGDRCADTGRPSSPPRHGRSAAISGTWSRTTRASRHERHTPSSLLSASSRGLHTTSSSTTFVVKYSSNDEITAR